LYEQKSAGGFRVLALATRTFEPRTGYRHDDEAALTFEGLLLFLDPAKSDVRGTIADLAGLGVEVKVISGDNRFITAHLAETVGIDSQLILTGEDLSGLGDEALWHRAPRTSLFVEVDPQQKERIVRALQRSGHTVGYMGDGINDAPALHAADVGISVDQAVDTARQSADIILLRRDLDVLRQGIEGGRRTFANTIKYINITTSANFGNMVSMAVAAPLLPFLPLLPKQILLNNFLSDLPSLAISTDSVDLESVSHPQSWDIRKIQQFMILFGLTSSVFDFITFAVLLLVFRVDEAAFQTSWFVVSLLSELAVLLVLRTKGPVLKSRPGRLLLWTTVAVAAVCVLAPYLGGPSTLFGFVTLTSRDLVACLLIVCGYVAVTEALKRWFYRRGFGALLAVPRLSSKR
jgi:Mg2+-importing ATPase